MYLVFSEWGFRKYDVPEYVRMVKKFAARIKSAARYHEILVGEWCLGNHSPLIKSLDEDGKRSFYRSLADAQFDAFDQSLGSCYWSLRVDDGKHRDWDLRTCVREGWLDVRYGR